MAVKVRIKNFQSIREADLEISGLTVLTGPNDSGKSAVRRAIEGVFQNTPGHHFVRNGADKCEVEVTLDDGVSVRWEKGSAIKPTYTLTTSEGSKTLYPGRGVPDEVLALGVNTVQAGSRDLWPQFAQQIQGVVFLLDQPGSVIAEAVADVERVSTLNEAMRQAERDLRAARNTMKVRRKDQADLEAELATFEGLDDVINTVQVLEADHAQLQRDGGEIQALLVLRNRRAEVLATISRLEPAEQIEIPTGVHDLLRIEAEISTAIRLRARLASARAEVARYQGVENIALDLDQAEGVTQKVWSALEVLNQVRGRLRRSLAETSSLRDELERTNEAFALAQEEVDELLLLIPECPTCGATTAEGEDHDHHS